jgi:2-aminoadipate transaminase
MSYKLDLSELARDGDVSLTQQLVDRFRDAIDEGALEPGEKLPTTRALAAQAGINHLTAARVYRRLAELGYVTASVGRGTFVRTLPPASAEEQGDDWQVYALPDRPPTFAEQVASDSFRYATEPGMTSLATGWPSPDLYPTRELAEITARVFAEEGGEAISYISAEGLWELREQIAALGPPSGIPLDPEDVVITSGARQAIDLAARVILEPTDVVVVESPSFVGLVNSLRATGARTIGVPVDEDGFDVDALERVLARHEVKLVALQPTCQNPTGRDLSPERAERLTRLAVERNFFILEDAVYSGIRFEGEEPPSLRGRAPGHVIRVNSLSKTVGGGLRLGWVAARGPVRERIAALKVETDFHTSTLVQHIGARFLASGGHQRQLDSSVPVYRQRRDALLEALERHLEGEYRAIKPRGGHHVWVTLNRPLNERDLYAEAARHGVTFTPGQAVTVERPAHTSFRLSYPLLEPEELDEGVRRLARAIREVRRRTRQAVTMPLS